VKHLTRVDVISVDDWEETTKPVLSIRPSPIRLCMILLDTENIAKPMYADARVCMSTPWMTHQMSDAAVDPWPRPKIRLEMDD
jgi:hypothetical protein